MTASTWIHQAIGEDRLRQASADTQRRRLTVALDLAPKETDVQNLELVSNALQVGLFDALQDDTRSDDRRTLAAEIFGIARTLTWPEDNIARAEWLVRLGCFSVIGDRAVDFRRILMEYPLPKLTRESDNWGNVVWSSVLRVWLLLFRQKGWGDLEDVQKHVAYIRNVQRRLEPEFLQKAQARKDTTPAWELVSRYHLAKASELLAEYMGQGSADGHFDIREQLEAQFDRAISAAARGLLVELEPLVRLLARTADVMVSNSIWTVTRAVNSRVNQFVRSLTSSGRENPIFEMLPPQRCALQEEGLLGSGHRSVVVNLPTSSGKTLIAELRILQALNQFDYENGWVAYVAPTRALVNQLTSRLRRDFSQVDVLVEKVSPALEVDGLEAGMLSETDQEQQFRILVTTPEKLDLIMRGGWEARIGRPLTLVVIDEAHGLASKSRGLKLELLLATINRECRHAQFLLLTPFIRNGLEIARWLSRDRSKSIGIGADWAPNDRVAAIVRVDKGSVRGDFSLRLITRHTTRKTLSVPEHIDIGERRPLGLSWSKVKDSPGAIAAVTAHALKRRGTTIVLANSPANTWSIARKFEVNANRIPLQKEDLKHVQRFLIQEMGADFPLAGLLEYGVGVHHAGMSDETRALVEWLAETGQLDVLVATTTIAQGLNFPVSGVIFATNQYRFPTPPHWRDMPPEDFWNIAGRAGRVNQGDIGVVALAANSDAKQHELEQFIEAAVKELNSTLIEMVQKVVTGGAKLQLHKLSRDPGWSAFVQYLAHTYRQIGNHEEFAARIEQILRGTLGFQSLRRSHAGWADGLVRSVYDYAEKIKGKPLSFVDATGFSWESVNALLGRLSAENLPADVWTAELFGDQREQLRKMMGILLDVPELRNQLKDVTGGSHPDGHRLTQIICDWVQGIPLPEMAGKFFGTADAAADPVKAMTQCCKSVFGKLTQTASWGLSALQTLTLGSTMESLAAEEQRSLRNLPARVYYGVNSDEAVALRLLGVPRTAATRLAAHLAIKPDEPLHQVRLRLRKASAVEWTRAMGDLGVSYHRVWSIIEGMS
ncbi:MAG: DEAD/DEAH box helicase [Bacteroidota bacterium]|nr:DEAD/DEAH box helicase [Bacteroidota bacterium]